MNFQGTDLEDRLNFEFTILDNKNFKYKDEEGEEQIESTKGRRLWKRISPVNSGGGKKSRASWFYKLLCAVEKKELDPDALPDVAPATMVGQQLVVMVDVAGEYNNILSFAPIEKNLDPIPNADERAELKAAQEEASEPKKQLAKEEVDDEELPF